MEVLVSFAQHAQDVILVHALKDYNPREVFWIDVGSNDPVNISVTLLFSMLGGHGINIEPQEMYRKRYENLRQRDINLFGQVEYRPECICYVADERPDTESHRKQYRVGRPDCMFR